MNRGERAACGVHEYRTRLTPSVRPGVSKQECSYDFSKMTNSVCCVPLADLVSRLYQVQESDVSPTPEPETSPAVSSPNRRGDRPSTRGGTALSRTQRLTGTNTYAPMAAHGGGVCGAEMTDAPSAPTPELDTLRALWRPRTE